jgi:hypothetical protein
MSFDPKTGGPCAVADIRRGALRDIAQVLKEHEKRKHQPQQENIVPGETMLELIERLQTDIAKLKNLLK